MQVVDRVIGRTFTGGVTAVVSFNGLPPPSHSCSQARLQAGEVDPDKKIDTVIMVALAVALVPKMMKIEVC